MHGNGDNDCRGRREETTGKTSKRAGEELTGKLSKRKLEEKRGKKRCEREEAGTEGEGSAVASVSALSKLVGPLTRAGGGGSTQLQTQPQSLEGFEVAEAVTQVAVEDASAGSHGEAGWGQTAPGGPEVPGGQERRRRLCGKSRGAQVLPQVRGGLGGGCQLCGKSRGAQGVRLREDGAGVERCPEVPETSVLGGTRRTSNHMSSRDIAAANERAWQRRLAIFRHQRQERDAEGAQDGQPQRKRQRATDQQKSDEYKHHD